MFKDLGYPIYYWETSYVIDLILPPLPNKSIKQRGKRVRDRGCYFFKKAAILSTFNVVN